MAEKAVIEIDIEKAKKDLENLTKTIKDLNAAGDDNEETVKALEKQWETLDTQIKKAEGTTGSLNKELKDLVKQLQVMKLEGKENTQAYQDMVSRAGALKDAISDTATAVNKTASDTANLDAVLSGASAVSGGFGLAMSTMSLLGKDTEDVAKAQKRLQEAIALVNSVQAIANSLNKDSALMVRANAIANKLLGKTMQGVAASTTAATTAAKGFKTAMVQTGIGALVLGLGFVANKMLDYVERTRDAQTETKKLNNEKLDKLQKEIDSVVEKAEQYRKSIVDINFDIATAGMSRIEKEQAKINKLVEEESAKHLEMQQMIERRESTGRAWTAEEQARFDLLGKERISLQDAITLHNKRIELYKKEDALEAEKQAKAEKEKKHQEAINKAIQERNEYLNKLKTLIGDIESMNIRILQSTTDTKAATIKSYDELKEFYKSQNDVLNEATAKTVEIKKNIAGGEKSLAYLKGVYDEMTKHPTGKFTEADKKYFNWYSQYIKAQSDLVNVLKTNLGTTETAISTLYSSLLELQTLESSDMGNVLVSEYANIDKLEETLKALKGEAYDESNIIKSVFDSYKEAGKEGVNELFVYIQKRKDLLKNYIIDSLTEDLNVYKGNLEVAELLDEVFGGYEDDVIKAQHDVFVQERAIELARVDFKEKAMLEAGVNEVKINDWVKTEKAQINAKYDALEAKSDKERLDRKRKAAIENVQLGISTFKQLSDAAGAAFEEDKKIQIATTVMSGTADVGQAVTEIWAKYAEVPYLAAALSAAAVATGAANISAAVRNIKKTTKTSSSYSGQSSGSASGSSRDAVSSQLIYNRVSPTAGEEKYTSVLVVDEVTAKQKQIANSDRVRVM